MSDEETTEGGPDYQRLFQQSYLRCLPGIMRDMVRHLLAEAAEEGLPGGHHLYISFKTDAEGVEMPAFLRDQYPDELTVVLGHQYWDLVVDETTFAVTLSFAGKQHRLMVPFQAMMSFSDPDGQFGLQFEGSKGMAGEEPDTAETDSIPAEEGQIPPGGAEVVDFESFRKR